MDNKIKRELGAIWKQNKLWYVQFPGGRMGFKTKKIAEKFANSLGIRR